MTRNSCVPFCAARLEATALVHLLDMTDRLWGLAGLGDPNELGPEGLRRQAGAEVVKLAAAVQTAERSLEVALLADGLAECRLQPARVDDGVVHRIRDRLGPHAASDVQLPGAVTALAADRVPVEHRFGVAVHRARDV